MIGRIEKASSRSDGLAMIFDGDEGFGSVKFGGNVGIGEKLDEAAGGGNRFALKMSPERFDGVCRN